MQIPRWGFCRNNVYLSNSFHPMEQRKTSGNMKSGFSRFLIITADVVGRAATRSMPEIRISGKMKTDNFITDNVQRAWVAGIGTFIIFSHFS